jgi:hypothetical protein
VAEEGDPATREVEAIAVVACPAPAPVDVKLEAEINEPGITSGESGKETQDERVVGNKGELIAYHRHRERRWHPRGPRAAGAEEKRLIS